MLSEKKILVTGGAGFIGSNLARRLVSEGAEVTLVDSLIPEYGGNLYNLSDISKEVRVNISDVRDPHSMRHLVKGVDIVFNLAGQTSHMDSMRDPFTDLEINSRAQLSILESLRHHAPTARVVFASTRQIYGRPEYLPVDEKHPLRPIDVNGVNKISGEHYHMLYHQVYGIPTCILRLTNTYGPGMRICDARQTFVGIWIKNIIQDKSFEVWGGDQLRDFNYVGDVVDAFILAALDFRAVGKIFNLGSSEIINLTQLAQLLVDVGKKGAYKIMEFPEERKKIDIGDYYSDFSLINESLGWTPKIFLEEGMKETIQYFKKNFEHYL